MDLRLINTPLWQTRTLAKRDNIVHLHIIGICGTFMGSLAQLAVEKGYRVTGCDQHVYPPMSDQLERVGIELIQGFSADQIDLKPDLWVIGNAMSRGNPLVEAVLDRGFKYTSGPEFLAEHILPGKWVLAVSGTHGKSTTTSMLTWILEYAGFNPGFLIGGVPSNFSQSARLGAGDFFVIEADEYDSAFFDKRSKFVHYRPRTLVINNLEFDHADIFADLSSIQTQFHHLLRTVPALGQVIVPIADKAVQEVIEMGCWAPVQTMNGGIDDGDDVEQADFYARSIAEDDSAFEVFFQGESQGELRWSMLGDHNKKNAVAAIAAARSVGVSPHVSLAALAEFSGIKRRMEVIGRTAKTVIYDDFAHHPTAIASTLDGLRKHVGAERIVAVIEPRSHTMKAGVHKDMLAQSAVLADEVYWYQADDLGWSIAETLKDSPAQCVETDIESLLESLVGEVEQGAHLVIMSNGGFGGLHQKLLENVNVV